MHGYEAFENAEFTIYGDPCKGFMKQGQLASNCIFKYPMEPTCNVQRQCLGQMSQWSGDESEWVEYQVLEGIPTLDNVIFSFGR